MTKRPRISVLMTVFNAGRFLAPAVESIRAQSFADFEFVIVDDASSDGSEEVLRDFAARDPRVTLLRNEENLGQTASLNRGIREARGEWIARQDADDLSLPDRLRVTRRLIESTPNLVLAGTNGWIIDEGDAVTGLIHAPLSDGGIRWAMPFRNPFIHAAVAFRRTLPNGSPVQYDERFRICQDWELWSRLVDLGAARNSPERLVAYRHRENSLSHESAARTRAEGDAVAGEIWRRRFPARRLDDRSAALLRSFREGLTLADRRAFWDFYRETARGWGGHRLLSGGEGQAKAVHHLQAAGALAARSRSAMAGELWSAFRCAPRWFLRTVRERIGGGKRVPAGRFRSAADDRGRASIG